MVINKLVNGIKSCIKASKRNKLSTNCNKRGLNRNKPRIKLYYIWHKW